MSLSVAAVGALPPGGTAAAAAAGPPGPLRPDLGPLLRLRMDTSWSNFLFQVRLPRCLLCFLGWAGWGIAGAGEGAAGGHGGVRGKEALLCSSGCSALDLEHHPCLDE